jgi:hypothetical protein
MRKEAGHWHLARTGESAQGALARFFIGVEELRARLNPQQYPNLELSDEGHLWFNVPSALGNWEVLALPYGLADLPGPALLLSFPHRPDERGKDLLAALEAAGAGSILLAAFASTGETLQAFAANRLPPLHLLRGREEIGAGYDLADFFGYFGLYVPVAQLTVQAAEELLRGAVARLEDVRRRPCST